MAFSTRRSLLAKTSLLLLPFIKSILAQNATLTVDNTTYVANVSTLAPAEDILSIDSSASDAELFEAETAQLTDAVLANLTSIQLTNVSLFDFDTTTEETVEKRGSGASCKVFPGDFLWPNKLIWGLFDLVLGGRLIETVPSAASCYNNWPKERDANECTYVTNEFTSSYFHMEDPTSVMWPLYQGRTCMPTTNPNDVCTLGAYPSYAVNVSKVSHIQLAVNFARNANLRLVVKNTGHDFNGKSAGAGALSVWTHHLKDITVIPKYVSKAWSGKAMKLGAGVQAFEIYEAAQAGGFTVVGGEGRTVGVAGGYVAGGGHSPLSSIYGMAADQVLAFEVVTPDGRFVTATDDVNSDLFWALRGGGGSTFGVVTSVVVKTYPIIPVTTMTFTFSTDANVTSAAFWEAIRSYMLGFVDYSNAGNYAYFSIFNIGPDAFLFSMAPLFAPNMTIAQTQALYAPWFAKLKSLGITITPVVNHYDNFYDAWYAAFPLETVGITSIKTASRLFPKSNWNSATSFNATFEAIKSTIEDGGSFLSFNIAAPLKSTNTANSVNPAWRNTVLHAILAVVFTDTTNTSLIQQQSKQLTNDWMQRWRDVSPGAGAYMSEADANEPNFQQAFYGSNYDKLYAIKQKYDRTGLFYAHTAVGSEDWYITGQVDGIPTQNGRLCRV